MWTRSGSPPFDSTSHSPSTGGVSWWAGPVCRGPRSKWRAEGVAVRQWLGAGMCARVCTPVASRHVAGCRVDVCMGGGGEAVCGGAGDCAARCGVRRGDAGHGGAQGQHCAPGRRIQRRFSGCTQRAAAPAAGGPAAPSRSFSPSGRSGHGAAAPLYHCCRGPITPQETYPFDGPLLSE